MASSPVRLQDVLTVIDRIAPFSLAASWDNVGLLVGTPEHGVSKLLIGLDPTLDLLDEAIEQGAQLVVTHHPIIFQPLKAIRTDQAIGAFLAKAIKNDIAVVGCHTNLDVVANGVSTILAEKIGLTDLTPITQTSPDDPAIGFGQTGTLSPLQSAEQFLDTLCQALDLPVLTMAGPLPDRVGRVAVCGGSGSDLSEAAMAAGAEVYITGEVKHSVARWAEESGICIIDGGHYATENLVVPALAAIFEKVFREDGPQVEIVTTCRQKSPFSYYTRK